MSARKGIVLAGGVGTRLHPLTDGVCKQLLPVYDKPMVYFPVSLLMLANIRDILIISTPNDTPILEQILGTGERYGIRLTYAVQERPRGIAEALIIADKFLNGSPSALVLGDNLLFGQDLSALLRSADKVEKGATIFGYWVNEPRDYGVVEFDSQKRVISIEEKPIKPKSNYIVPGLYFFDSDASTRVTNLKPSARGELEILDLHKTYLDDGLLSMEMLGRGTVWLDMGTPQNLHRAAIFVENMQTIQGGQIANLEEMAVRKGWISVEGLSALIADKPNSQYFQYLSRVLEELR